MKFQQITQKFVQNEFYKLCDGYDSQQSKGDGSPRAFQIKVINRELRRRGLRDFKKLGKPNLFFGVTSGCMDSMVNHYTAQKRLRSNDAYTPGGKAGFRPDYAEYVIKFASLKASYLNIVFASINLNNQVF